MSLDVANAFNTVPWVQVDAALQSKGVPTYLIRTIRSYFDMRTIQTDVGPHDVTAGVPQGSVIGPLLWNVFYDSLMRLDFPQGVHIVCFADDAAIVATGHTTRLLENAMNDSLSMVADWMDSHGLIISSTKSAAVMLTTKRGYVKPTFLYKGVQIELREHTRYLGLELSLVLGFRKHIETASEKATKTASALSRLMPNVGGPSPAKRRLLTTVVHSQLWYAAQVWSGALMYGRNRKTLASPQRKMALRVISAYCTVSNEAAMVVAGIAPIHLLAIKRAEIERDKQCGLPITAAKENAGARVNERWQDEWENAGNGRWTYRLIPIIQRWRNKRYGQVGFHLTQFLTGHDCFNVYLKRFKKREDSTCFYCANPFDNVEHTFFECDRWWRWRKELEVALNFSLLTPETMMEAMLEYRAK